LLATQEEGTPMLIIQRPEVEAGEADVWNGL
jgi:hypothetical protein